MRVRLIRKNDEVSREDIVYLSTRNINLLYLFLFVIFISLGRKDTDEFDILFQKIVENE